MRMPFRPIAGGSIVVIETPLSQRTAAAQLGQDAARGLSEIAIGPTTAIDIEARPE